MAKRRNVIMGLGAMAVGSGTVFGASASFGETTDPTADFQILADALEVRAGENADDEGDIDVTDSLASFGESPFDRDGLPHAQVNEETNSELIIRAGGVTNDSNDFTGIIEIVNNTSEDEDVRINYAQDATDDSSDWGYGDDVAEQGSGGTIEPEHANDIFEFTNNADGTRISPAPSEADTASETGLGDNWVTVNSGETLLVDLTVDTSDYTGDINSVAGTGGTFGDEGSFVDIISTAWVEINDS